MQRCALGAPCAAPARAPARRRAAPPPRPAHVKRCARRALAPPPRRARAHLLPARAAAPDGDAPPDAGAARTPFEPAHAPPHAPATPPSSVSVWAFKPPWCQPWSILATGSLAVAGSWQLFHAAWLSVPVGGAVALWWYIFLVAYPAQFAAYIAEAERRGVDWRAQLDEMV